MSFITTYYDQSDEFNVIGQQVNYCRRPHEGPEGIMSSSAIYGILHSDWAITNTWRCVTELIPPSLHVD